MNVCAHAAWGPIRGDSQTAGSMLARLKGDDVTHWFTGTSAPCTSIFKPVWFDAGEQLTAVFGPAPDATYDEAARWWRHELLHRATLEDYVTRHPLYRAERDALEVEFFAGALETSDRAGYAVECFRRADAAETEWTERVKNTPLRRRPGPLYRRFWAGQNSDARL